jgi:uncharacterized protein YqcC (DUF446 family)
VRAGELADRLEAELRRLGAWVDAPPSEEEVLAGGAFGMGTVPCETWIQVVLVERLRAVERGEMALPGSSSLAAHAVRELDGRTDRDDLIDLLHEVDGLAGGPPA